MSRRDKYTKELREVLNYAREEARRLCYRLVNTEHLLLGLLKINDPLIEGIFVSLQNSTARVSQAMEFVVGRSNKAILGETSLGPAARATMAYAAEEAALLEAEFVGLEHLLLGILHEQNGTAAGVLASLDITLEKVREKIQHFTAEEVEQMRFSGRYLARYNATPTLNAVSRDLTRAALEGKLSPLIGREVELERTMQILARKSKNNPVLLGPAGVGKTAIAEGLALRIIQEQVPDNLLGCRVVSLETGLLTVGTKFRGDFEERLQTIMQEIVKTPDIIIVIDELHTLMSTGVSEGSMDAANLFKPLLARGEFRCIGATTPEDYRRVIESDPALERRFQPVSVGETSALETLDILRGLRGYYADFHQLAITDQALVAAVTLSSRYIQSRFQPDKALDVLDEAAARVRVQYAQPSTEILQMRDEIVAVRREKDYAIARSDFPQALAFLKRERALNLALNQAEQDWRANRQQQLPTVSEQDIADIVERWTGIPLARIVSNEAQQLLNLEDDLHRRIVGQHEAVQAVAKAVRRSRTDIRDSRRPIGSFLFVGPSGVGKTELAHALAASLFGDESALLKLDMSEFMESHSVSRLIGSPPGYLGYDQPGQLTEAVRRRPYSIVLFDEIEKAHPKIFDLLLQILEEGRLTDARGQSVDFRHTIVILTSNAGTEHTRSNNIAFTADRLRRAEHVTGIQEHTRLRVMVAVKEILRPELFNRIDDIVVFHSLGQEHLYAIADLMLARTRQRLAALSIGLQVTEAARTFLVQSAYSPAGGARHLRHTIQRLLEDMLATGLLNNSFAANDSVVVDVIDGCLNAHKLEEKSMVAVAGEHNQNAA